MSKIVRLFRGKQQEKDLFTELLRPHVDVMYRMAYRWTGNQQDAEDIVQDVLIKLADRLDELTNVEKLRPWLIKVVYRRFVDTHRQAQRRPEILETDLRQTESATGAMEQAAHMHMATAPDHAPQIDMQRSLKAALSQLPGDQRDTILLHDAEGYSAAEVAEILEVSVGTVKSRLHRGREKLKKILQEGTF